MKRALLIAGLFLLAFPLLAVDTNDCSGPLTHLGALYQLRALMMHRDTSTSDIDSFIDSRIEDLRGPQPGGGYKWVRWMRPSSSDAPYDKKVHTVNAVYNNGDPDSFEASSDHIYAVRLAVPSKRSLFKGNRPVYVGDVDVNGRVTHINKWMNPDTSQTFDLRGIQDHVTATVQASTGEKDAHDSVVEFHFMQAVASDDPANPSYSTIKALQRVRANPDAATIDSEIAALESSLFPGSDPIPMLTILHDLRRAAELMRSDKADDKEKGDRLLKDTLRRLR
ncbi:MAG TPA: hypothetical protein VLU46_01485 [Thermoanaerobaculia bacterium]|nr:hypothetical protein [Thermoanaerobaculia bacterium]